jgi:serine/threonine-protein kinase HipA
MAVASGIDVPEAKLFKSTQHPGFFGVKRFDRTKDGPVHMHTASGLLHADHRTLSLDYESLIKATLHLTKDERECAKQFRNAVFNVLTHNRDDHAKNFSFLMNTDGAWHVSPAYDLTFSFGPGGEHSTTIMGEGKNPDLNHLLRLAMIGGIKQQKAVSIIDEVKGVVSRWPDFAKNTGVTPRSLTMVSDKINAILTRF